MGDEEFWELEREFWLGGVSVYETRLAAQSLMVLPEPAGVLEREETIKSIKSAPRWSSVEIFNKKTAFPSARVTVLTYRAHAARGDAHEYIAQCSSVYIWENEEWKLTLHHQSPLTP
jgi:hypothetical protein